MWSTGDVHDSTGNDWCCDFQPANRLRAQVQAQPSGNVHPETPGMCTLCRCDIPTVTVSPSQESLLVMCPESVHSVPGSECWDLESSTHREFCSPQPNNTLQQPESRVYHTDRTLLPCDECRSAAAFTVRQCERLSSGCKVGSIPGYPHLNHHKLFGGACAESGET